MGTPMDAEDDHLEQQLARRRRAENRPLIVVGAILGVLVVVLVAFAIGRAGKGLPSIGGPSASSEGETWTHKELAEYLGKKGVPVEIHGGGTMHGQVVSDFADPKTSPPGGLRVGRDKWVRVALFPTAQSAKEDAAAKGGVAFAWGRFVFSEWGDHDLLARIRKTIGA